MTPTIVPSFDGVTSTDSHCGSMLALDNGTVAFTLNLPPRFGQNGSVAIAMLDASLAARGLTWGTFEYGRTTRQGYVSRLERPTEEKPGPTVQTTSGSIRLARSNEQIAALAEVVGAFQSGDLSPLLTAEARAIEQREQVRAQKKAAKAEADAQAFAHSNWPKAAFGMSVSETTQGLVLRFEYDAAVVKAVKASKAVWNSPRKTWTLPREQEVAFGKRLMKIAKELGKASDEKGISLADQARQREAELLEEERTVPLAGRVGSLTIGVRHYPYAPPGQQHSYALQFPYDAAMIRLVRGVPGAKFNREARQWEVPLIARKSLAHKMQYLRQHALECEERELAAGNEAQEFAAERPPATAAAGAFEKLGRDAKNDAAQHPATRNGSWHVYRFAERDGEGLPTGIYQDGEDWNVVVERSRGRYVEDASSLGGDMCREYQFRLTLRAATPEEVERALAARAQADAMGKEARARSEAFDLLDAAFRLADRPEQVDLPQGLPSTSRGYLMNINGRMRWMANGWAKFIVDKTLGKVWRVQANGLDGDDWSRNNYGSGIASWLRLEGADKVVAFLEAARAPLTSPAPALTADDVNAWAMPAQSQVLCAHKRAHP